MFFFLMMNLKFVLWEYISIGKMKTLEMAERVSLICLFFLLFWFEACSHEGLG